MYQVILVDDDRLVRARLNNEIDWKKLGLEVCGEAADGNEAVALYQQELPALCILDINIPNKDGLEVASEILARDRDTIIIMITGYNDFEYAQRALKTGVFDILAKPIDPKELERVLTKGILHLEERKQEQMDHARMNLTVQESLPILRKMLLSDLLHGRIGADFSHVPERLERFQIDLINQYYGVAVLVPQMMDIEAKDIELMFVALSNIAEELLLSAGFGCQTLFDGFSSEIVILSWRDAATAESLEDTFANIRNKVLYYFSFDMYVGIGGTVKRMEQLPVSLEDAKEALNYRNTFGRNNVVNIKNVIRVFNHATRSNKGSVEEIVQLFKAGDFHELSRRAVALTGEIASSSENLKRVFLELTVLLFRACEDVGVAPEEVLGRDDPYQRILRNDSATRLIEEFLQLCRQLMEAINGKRENHTYRIVEQAKDYIAEHLGDSGLGLVEISDYVGLSSVYFSQLFHGGSGVGINQYINQARIEKAKSLLKNTTMKIYEIAEAAGYSNPKYFNYIFKKVVGITPREYKLQ